MKSSLYPEQLLQRRAMAWAIKLKVNPSRVVIQDLRTKWGSCSSDGVVTLAEDLVEMEPDFQDYVIVHELIHIRVPSHGKHFQALLSAHIPEWRALETSVGATGRRIDE